MLEDVGHGIVRLPRAIGRGARATWRGMSVETRRRFAAAVGAVAALTAIWLFAIPVLPCAFPGGDQCPPPDDAIELVPADALAYVHVNLDPDSDQYEELAALADRLPLISRQVSSRLLARIPGPRGAPARFQADLEPWFGDQAAVAVVRSSGRAADQVQLLQASDEDRAREFAEEIAAGSPKTGDYRGVDVARDKRGLTTALVEGFLAIGTRSGVRSVIDAGTGAEGAESLADSAVADAARDALPAGRVATAFVSREGAAELIAPARGPLARLEPFVASASTRGAGFALIPSDDRLELAVRSPLDPERATTDPSFFAAFPAFEPHLADELAPGALAYLGFGDPERAVKALLAQASAEAPGIAEGFGDLVARLRRLGKVDLGEDLLPALGNEAALAIEPKPAVEPRGSARDQQLTVPAPAPATDGDIVPPSPVPESPVPYVGFLSDGIDEERARQALARLQGPLAGALDPGTNLQAPVFDRREIDGTDAHSLRLSPTVNLTYAVFDSKLVIATDPTGVSRVASGDGGLDEEDRFGAATDGFAERPSLLAYLNVADLLELGERAGLAEIPAYATFAGEIRQLDAAGLAVEARQTSLDTDLKIVLGEPDEAESDGPPAPAPAE